MLAQATLARPYARAAFEAAESAGELDRWSAALEIAAQVAASPEVRRLIGDPRLEADQLVELFAGVMGERLTQSARNFLKVLINYRRLSLLPEIASQFEHFRRRHEKRLRVQVTSAVELSRDQRRKLAERLSRRFGSEVEMETDVDKDLLGGLVVRAGDHVIDASVRGRLEKLGRELSR